MAKKFRFQKHYIEFDINGHTRRVEDNDELMIIGDEIAKRAMELDDKFDDGSDIHEVLKAYHTFFKFDFYEKLFGAGSFDEDFDEQPPFAFEQEIIAGVLAEIQASQNKRIADATGVSEKDLNAARLAALPQDYQPKKNKRSKK